MEPIQAPLLNRLLIGCGVFLVLGSGPAARADILVSALNQGPEVGASGMVAGAADSGPYRARDAGAGEDAEVVALSTAQVLQLVATTIAIPWASDEGGGGASESAGNNSVTNAPHSGQNSSTNSTNSDSSHGSGTSSSTDQGQISETPEPGSLALSILGSGTWLASLFRRCRR